MARTRPPARGKSVTKKRPPARGKSVTKKRPPGSSAGRTAALEQPNQSFLWPGVQDPAIQAEKADEPQLQTITVTRDFGAGIETTSSEPDKIYPPTVTIGPARPAGQTAASLSIVIPAEDREELSRRLDAIDAMVQQIMPTLEAIRAALDERSQIGHNNPPEAIETLPIEDVDLRLIAAAVTAARVEIQEEQARADVLRFSALSLKKTAASVSLWLTTKADTFAEAFAKSAGTEAGKRLVQGGALIALYPALHQLVADLGEFATYILKIVGY
jgi:hypothetical protein